MEIQISCQKAQKSQNGVAFLIISTKTIKRGLYKSLLINFYWKKGFDARPGIQYNYCRLLQGVNHQFFSLKLDFPCSLINDSPPTWNAFRSLSRLQVIKMVMATCLKNALAMFNARFSCTFVLLSPCSHIVCTKLQVSFTVNMFIGAEMSVAVCTVDQW